MRLPIRARLTLWYSAVLVSILAGVGLFVVAQLNTSLVRNVDEGLAARAQVLSQDISQHIPASSLPRAAVNNVVVQLVDVRGHVLEAGGEDVVTTSLLARSDVRRSLRGSLRRTVRAHKGGTEYRVFATAYAGPHVRPTVLIVGSEVEDIQRTLRGLIVLLLFAAPVAVALAAAGGWVLARTALRPVDVMTKTAASVDASGPHHVIPVPKTKDELSRLSNTLNAMLARLHAAIDQERRFSADASHELRTPLGIMSAELDVALRSTTANDPMRPVLESVREEVARLSRTTENLFLLARLDEPDDVGFLHADVDLLAIARQSAERFERAAAERGIELRVEGEHATVDGDPDSISQTVANLVDNAIKFTERDGRVYIRVEQTGSEALLTVADTGVGIAQDDLAHIFDRFYRVDKARSRRTGGAGLGLAIVRRLVDVHGGRVEVTSTLGTGTSVAVRLPVAQ